MIDLIVIVSNMEWDSYTMLCTDGMYVLHPKVTIIIEFMFYSM